MPEDKREAETKPKFDAAGEGAMGAYRACTDKSGSLFNIGMLSCKRTLKGHQRKVTALGWKDNPSEPAQIVGADQNHKVIHWDAKSGMKRQIYSSSFVMSADIHPTKDLIAIGSMQNVCAIIDMSMSLAEGAKKRSLEGHDGYIGSVKWIEGGSKLVSAGGDAEIKLWDAEKGQEITTLFGHEVDAGSISFAAGVKDWNVFCTGSTDRTVKMWDLRMSSGPNSCVMSFKAEGEVNCCAMFPSGNGVVAGCETCERSKMEGKAPEDWEKVTGAATFFDVRSGAVLSKYTRRKQKCTNVQWSKSGRILFISYEDGNVGMWDPWAESGIKHKIPAHVSQTGNGTSSVISTMAISPDGQVLATAGFDGLIKIFGPGE